MALFTPAWQKDNEAKALKFVEKCNVQEQLKTIALEAPLVQVRLAAAGKLRFEEDIAQVVLDGANSDNTEFAKQSIARLSSPEILKSIVFTSGSDEVRLTAIKKIVTDKDGERCLLEIAEANIDTEIGRTALQRVQKNAIWVKTAMKSKDVEFRMQAVRVPVADTVLFEITMSDENEVIRLAALVKIYDLDLIVRVVLENDNENVRVAAFKRIDDPQRHSVVAEKSDDRSFALPALENVSDNDRLKELVASACLIDVRSSALNRLSAENQVKEKLAYKIIPDYDARRDMAIRVIDPGYVPYLTGYEDVLLAVATGADSLDSSIEALCLLQKPDHIKMAVKRINKINGADKRLPLVRSKLADEEARQNADEALEKAMIMLRVEANELLAESVIRYNDYRLLDTVTDPRALNTIVERVSSKPDAYDICRGILRKSENESVKAAFSELLPELEERKKNKLRHTVVSNEYRIQEQYDAAMELIHKFGVSGDGDDELKEKYRELLNIKSIRTDRMLLELAKLGSDIDGIYERLIADADTLWELDVLANYPTEQTIKTLSDIISTPGDPLRSLRAVNALKMMYEKADAQTKAGIKQVPQKVYQEHFDSGAANCHTDSPEVAFFLED